MEGWPTAEPRRTHTVSLTKGSISGLGSGEAAQERGCFCGPSAADFRAEGALEALPLIEAVPARAVPSLRTRETMVVSMANCVPFHNGKPSATTSNLRPSSWLNAWRSMSRLSTHTTPQNPCCPACCTVVAKKRRRDGHTGKNEAKGQWDGGGTECEKVEVLNGTPFWKGLP